MVMRGWGRGREEGDSCLGWTRPVYGPPRLSTSHPQPTSPATFQKRIAILKRAMTLAKMGYHYECVAILMEELGGE